MEKKIPILILTGPTAVGKTELSIKLAKKINGEIISADSMQIYKYMDIGSAKVTEDEMMGIKHHLIDIVYPDQEFSVSEFSNLADKSIKEIDLDGKLPIITGGTGLYLNSIIYDMDFGKSKSNSLIRDQLNDIYEKEGKEYLYNMLLELSPEAAKNIHPNNVKRVIRAIEVYKTGGQLGNFSTDLKFNPKYDVKIVILNRDREVLYNRINKRVDIMIEKGLLKEVENLHKLGYTKDMVSMKAIGYKEIIDYFNNEIELEEVINLIKQSSRRYAKRQITWFKRYNDALWIDLDKVTDINEQLNLILMHIGK